MRRRLPDRKGQGCAGRDVRPNRLLRGYHTPAPCVAAPRALCVSLISEAMESQAGFTCPIQSSAPHIADDEETTGSSTRQASLNQTAIRNASGSD